MNKITIRDGVKMESHNIKNKLFIYKLALQTAKNYYDEKTNYPSIQEALSKVLLNNYLNRQSKFITFSQPNRYLFYRIMLVR